MKALNPGDFFETEAITNREFVLSETSPYLVVLHGDVHTGSFYTGSSPITTNGIYKGPFYHSIKSQFYSDKYRQETTQSIANSITAIIVSQSVYDEKIKENSVILTDASTQNIFIDDGGGNLKLSGSVYNVGNVFYEYGTIVITDNNIFDAIASGSFTLRFRSQHKKRTLNFSATVEPGEFNYSKNPTATMNGATTFTRPRYSYTLSQVSASYSQSISRETIIPEFFGFDPSGSTDNPLTPYVTTIGWYDVFGDLLAIAKLATPTPIPKDFPITFKARIDI
jgi:hypothetical protein